MQVNHVAIVGPLAPPAGGMANQTKQLANFLELEGLTVSIIQVNAPYQPAWVGKIPMLRAVFRLFDYKKQLKKRLADVDVVHVMANSGWSWHLFAAPAIRIAKKLNKPVILNYRGGYADEFFAKSWQSVKKTMGLVDEILVPSSFLQEVFAKYGIQASVVPNVLNQQRFNCENRTSVMRPTIIITRNLEAIYDVETAIKIFEKILMQFPQAELKVAGTGPELDKLVALCDELAIRSQVEFLGRLAPDDISALYKSADLMLNTSIVDNSPNSIIEALACGTPVVTTNVGGIPKLVRHLQDALLADIKDVDQLSALALSTLKDKALRDKLVANGLVTVEKFFWSNVWQKLQQSYQQAIKQVNYVS
ncbi:glycosyltransferase family 4 protein [Colwellia sp. MEBiC06753]